VSNARNPPLTLTDEVPVDLLLIEQPGPILAALTTDPSVAAAAPRLSATAMLLNEHGDSAPAVLIGIDPGRDADVCPGIRVLRGARLSGDGALLTGEGLAARLGVDPGAVVTAVLPSPDGLFDGDRFEIAGIYSASGLPLASELFVYAPLPQLQELLGAGQAVSSIAIRLKQGEVAADVKPRIEALLAQTNYGLRTQTWQEVGGELLGISQMSAAGLGAGFILLSLIVAIGIVNTSLMMVFERTRDIGTMLALGTARRQVLAAVLAEMGAIAAVAAATGTCAAAALVAVAGKTGIPAVSQAMAYAIGGERFYPVLYPEHLAVGFAGVALLALAAALYPAVHASRIDPVAALRHT